MVDYEVTVLTGNLVSSTCLNDVDIKLVGKDGESNSECLKERINLFFGLVGAVSTLTVSCQKSIGKLLMIQLQRKSKTTLPEDKWFLAKVAVKSPEGDTYHFPIFHWIDDNNMYMFREGKALLAKEDNLLEERKRELSFRETEYKWFELAPGVPHGIDAKAPDSLPNEVRFSFTKENEFLFTVIPRLTGLIFMSLADSELTWFQLKAFSKVFGETTPISAGAPEAIPGGPSDEKAEITDYVLKHWKDDDFFAYQFLNGVNPMLIRRCSVLPKNFPVTEGMVSLDGGQSLEDELKNGNIYLCDYKLFDGLEANTVNGKKQYLMAPLVLLHKTPQDKLMPIAIQLKQTPAKDNPIFFPNDPEHDWLLAKMFVRSAEFSNHQLNSHLLRTHLLAEVFSVSLLRNVPMVHPLYKLLVPHTRYTLQINVMARHTLISEDGLFARYASSGKAVNEILKRSLSEVTYSSLCMPENIAERGLEDVPNFHYKDDGLELWEIINRFVEGIITNYYETDDDVQSDGELQNWISDIFKEGFLSEEKSGIPKEFVKVTELVKFVTMVIFTCSAQHSAVNAGQLDYGSWMPNFPPSMQLSPPTTKGGSTEDTLLKTLPSIEVTVRGIFNMYVLSKPSADAVPLGQYPNQHFSEEAPLQMIKKFQEELKELEEKIANRNKILDVPYTYMKPSLMENSVAS